MNEVLVETEVKKVILNIEISIPCSYELDTMTATLEVGNVNGILSELIKELINLPLTEEHIVLCGELFQL